jgi:elongation factor Tu
MRADYFTRPPREPDLEAEIYAFRHDEGGRRTPFFTGYRPNHDFRLPNELNDGMHEYPDGDEIALGSTGKAVIWLLAPDRNAGRFFEGFEFTVQEGSRIVGRGKITKVVNPELKREGEPVRPDNVG